MSGSGRKSAYRKGVTDRVLYGDPEPQDNQQIVRVVALRGSNLFDVQNGKGDRFLTMLPTKFRKLIWVKRGDFLIVSESGEDTTTAKGTKGAVKSMIEHILYKDQIRNLRQKNLWPEAFDRPRNGAGKTQSESVAEDEDEEESSENDEKEDATTSNGIQMVNMNLGAMHINRNRQQGQYLDDSSEEEDDD